MQHLGAGPCLELIGYIFSASPVFSGMDSVTPHPPAPVSHPNPGNEVRKLPQRFSSQLCSSVLEAEQTQKGGPWCGFTMAFPGLGYVRDQELQRHGITGLTGTTTIQPTPGASQGKALHPCEKMRGCKVSRCTQSCSKQLCGMAGELQQIREAASVKVKATANS